MQGKNAVNPDGFTSILTKQRHNIYPPKSGSYSCAMLKHNVLFFCGAGKDRTGVVSAVMLKKLGYDDKTIIDDYMKTKENLQDYLISCVKEHRGVDIHTVMPNESNIKAILQVI